MKNMIEIGIPQSSEKIDKEKTYSLAEVELELELDREDYQKFPEPEDGENSIE